MKKRFAVAIGLCFIVLVLVLINATSVCDDFDDILPVTPKATPVGSRNQNGSNIEAEKPNKGEFSSKDTVVTKRPFIKGKLKWSSGKPVANASIRFNDQTKGDVETISDSEGAFLLLGLVKRAGDDITLSVKPKCWEMASKFVVKLMENENGQCLYLDVVIPDTVDLKVSLEVSVNVFELLNTHHYCKFSTEISEIRPPNSGLLFPKKFFTEQIPLSDLKFMKRADFTARVEYRDALTVVVFADVSGPVSLGFFSKRAVLVTRHFRVERDSVNRLMLKVNLDNCLTGQVTDHLDQPLPEALLYYEYQNNPRLFEMRVNSDGSFFEFFQDSDVKVNVTADWYGHKTHMRNCSPGSHDIKMIVDMSALKRFKLVRGNKIITDFRIGSHEYLFGKFRVPELPYRKQGFGWIPKWKNPYLENKMVLSWKEGNDFYEYSFDLDKVARDGYVIDLEQCQAKPCGELKVLFGDKKGIIVFIKPVHLLSRVNIPPVMASMDCKLFGFREGLYKIKLMPARSFPGQKPIKEFFFKCSENSRVLDIKVK